MLGSLMARAICSSSNYQEGGGEVGDGEWGKGMPGARAEDWGRPRRPQRFIRNSASASWYPRNRLRMGGPPMSYPHSGGLACYSGKSWDFGFRSVFGFFPAILLAM